MFHHWWSSSVKCICIQINDANEVICTTVNRTWKKILFYRIRPSLVRFYITRDDQGTGGPEITLRGKTGQLPWKRIQSSLKVTLKAQMHNLTRNSWIRNSRRNLTLKILYYLPWVEGILFSSHSIWIKDKIKILMVCSSQ